jgi:hypothetical protein
MLKQLVAWLNPGAIRTLDELAELIGTETARISQKATTGFCRSKAGAFVEMLFKEKVFLEALDVCRWGAFGLVLADVCLVVEGFLRPHAKNREDILESWILAAFDAELARHPEGDLAGDGWAEARAEFRSRLARSRQGAPVPAAEVGFDTAQRIYDSLPVHPRLRREDFELVQNLTRFGHITLREELDRRLDCAAVVASLPPVAKVA